MRYLLILSIGLLLFGCTGEESLGVDTQNPRKPDLIPHLGDTGDYSPGTNDTLNYYNTIDLDFENNGMDAVMEGDWLKIQWHRLEDSDIDYLQVYRFSAQDYYLDSLNFVQIIDTVDYNDQISYIDQAAFIDKNYFYFIKVFDFAGNSTVSDTTSYKLIDKPYLIAPSDNYSSVNVNSLVFEWQQSGSDAIQHRLLVFNENRELIWQNTPLDLEDFIVPYNGPPVEPGTVLIWRVDSFGISFTTPLPIEGNYYTIKSGAESVERYIFIE
ncbi:MAG: hypothetical protein K9N07_02955 [Candidatus Cloacimonetes bacterium]|nr:hypothetical protein [Candidatus Cloacimonadota bacterium]